MSFQYPIEIPGVTTTTLLKLRLTKLEKLKVKKKCLLKICPKLRENDLLDIIKNFFQDQLMMDFLEVRKKKFFKWQC